MALKTDRQRDMKFKDARKTQNDDGLHHPGPKTKQVMSILEGVKKKLRVLELFAGHGNLTKVYEQFGKVHAYDMHTLKTGDSFKVFHGLIANSETYDVIDMDPYGQPTRFFPDIFRLTRKKAIMFVTVPRLNVALPNEIVKEHNRIFWGSRFPDEDMVVRMMQHYGLMHWRRVTLLDTVYLRARGRGEVRLWRFALGVERVQPSILLGSCVNSGYFQMFGKEIKQYKKSHDQGRFFGDIDPNLDHPLLNGEKGREKKTRVKLHE